MSKLSIGDCISYAWNTFKQRPWFLIGAVLLLMVINVIPSLFQTHPEIGADGKIIHHPLTAYDAIVGLASLAVSLLVSLALTTLALRAHDDIHNVKLADLWNPGPFWSFLGASILVILAVGAAAVAFIIPAALVATFLSSNEVLLILLVIPGLIAGWFVALGVCFAGYVVVDRGFGPVQAIKESWRITSGNKLQLFLLGLALVGVALLGALALVVGVFVAFPVIMIAAAHAYRVLSA